jgi:quercetin dioxygenase-like cupin family protein
MVMEKQTNDGPSAGLRPNLEDGRDSFHEMSPGVELRILRQHSPLGGGGGLTFLVRMKHGSHAPLHDHPGGEETFILRGTLRVTNRRDTAGASLPDAEVHEGEYLFAPPGETHDGIAVTDALFLVVAPGGVGRR